jgi:hypothetical protein
MVINTAKKSSSTAAAKEKKLVALRKEDKTALAVPSNWNHIYEIESFQVNPEQGGYLKRLGYTMIEYAIRNEKALEILDFCIEYRISRKTLYSWVEKDAGLKESFDFFKLILANRKKKGAMNRTLDYNVVRNDLYKYDPEYVSSDRYQAQLKQTENLSNGNFVIFNDRPPVISKEQLAADYESMQGDKGLSVSENLLAADYESMQKEEPNQNENLNDEPI